MSALDLPEGFLFGASTSAHQTEGNNLASDAWVEEVRADSSMAQASGDACNSFERWRDDIDLVAEAGLNAYRFGAEWARVEPAQGRFSRAAVLHYRAMVEYSRSRGVEPVLTLHHFTSPAWFSARGGWLAPDAPALFVRYLDEMAPVIEAGIQMVVTINEPNILAVLATVRSGDQELLTGLGGALPPADPTLSTALIRAHEAARTALKSRFPQLDVGWSLASQAIRSVPGGEVAAAQYRESLEDTFLRPARDDDFIGVQSYSRAVFGPEGFMAPPGDASRTQTGWEYYPGALELAIRDAHAVVGPDTAILVTENGIATADDTERIAYTSGALEGMARAMADGIDVRGYLHWSLLDNYEWGSFDPTFGLVAVDPLTFDRHPKPSLSWLGRVASSGSLI